MSAGALAGGMIIGWGIGNSGINMFYLKGFLLISLFTISITYGVCKLLNYRDTKQGDKE